MERSFIFRVAFKPTATVLQVQNTVDEQGKETELMGRGRHDPCVLPRAVPIVGAMSALVLLDHQDETSCPMSFICISIIDER